MTEELLLTVFEQVAKESISTDQREIVTSHFKGRFWKLQADNLHISYQQISGTDYQTVC